MPNSEKPPAPRPDREVIIVNGIPVHVDNRTGTIWISVACDEWEAHAAFREIDILNRYR